MTTGYRSINCERPTGISKPSLNRCFVAIGQNPHEPMDDAAGCDAVLASAIVWTLSSALVAIGICSLVIGTEPASTHLFVLATLTVTLLAVAICRIEHIEYPTQQED